MSGDPGDPTPVFTFDHIWVGFLTVVSVLLGWLQLSHQREIDQMKKGVDEANKTADDAAAGLAKHQLYAAETYARKPDVEKAMEKSEERIMRRLDELSEEIKRHMPAKH